MVAISNNKDYDVVKISMTAPAPGNWRCYLFGTGPNKGIVFEPALGGVPNWFRRTMQFLLLGHRWVKQEIKISTIHFPPIK